RHLAARGVRHGVLAAILLERSPDLIVAMLAVLKTGAAYLPLEPSHPHPRLVATLTDSGASFLLTARAFTALSADVDGCAVVDIEADGAAIAAEPIHIETDPADAAYVIYTSGSTGKPKGVVVTHGNLAALLHGTTAIFDFSARDVWTMFHSAAFDFSVWEIFGALTSGARLVIVPTATAQSPEAFLRLLHEQAVTVLNQTPSAFVALSDWEREAALSLSLRYVIFGGEALRLEALSPWIARHGDSRPALINMFGITETTVHVTVRRITRRDVEEARGRSLIGFPIPGWTISLRNPDGGATPPGLVGEILVGGAGVARGYLKRPELDAERFIAISGRTGER
ncbi:MAG: AMP-binding protein, partial [Mesorhizobium sp.]|nr:AMP-binding protein [Mesorhizobium sp.]